MLARLVLGVGRSRCGLRQAGGLWQNDNALGLTHTGRYVNGCLVFIWVANLLHHLHAHCLLYVDVHVHVQHCITHK